MGIIVPIMSRPAAIVLDRDGVLNELWCEPEFGTVDSPLIPEQVRLTKNAAAAVRLINAAGIPCMVASNQPGIAKRKMTPHLLSAVTQKIIDELADKGANLDGIRYCLHHPESAVPALRRNCPDRKPAPGLLLRISKQLGLAPSDCWFIGDTTLDLQAGHAAGFRTAWIGNVRCDVCPIRDSMPPEVIADDLLGAVKIILEGVFIAGYDLARDVIDGAPRRI